MRSRSRVDGGDQEDARPLGSFESPITNEPHLLVKMTQDKGKGKVMDDSIGVGDAVITESGKERGVVIALETSSASLLDTPVAANLKDIPLPERNASSALSNTGVSGWDSDLTDLSDLSDLCESEIDALDSEEETVRSSYNFSQKF